MQPVDFTTLTALCHDLRTQSLPARLEQVVQPDRFTLCLALRTFTGRQWLALSWHPQAARLGTCSPPPRQPDTFTFNQQLVHQLGGLALVGLEFVAPWERAVALQFAQRPSDPILWHLYVEIMGQYSNVILTNQHNQIVTAAHQVSDRQSSVRPIQTGDRYVLPPSQSLAAPSAEEPLARWQERISLIPGTIGKNLRQPYQGVSTALATELVVAAGIATDRATTSLTDREWAALFDQWQTWLAALATNNFQPHLTPTGYSVMGWGESAELPTVSIQTLVDGYYTNQLNVLNFNQLHHRLQQQVTNSLKKLKVKRQGFDQRLGQADRADTSRQQADLLMAHLQQWSPGLTVLELPDFETAAPVRIALSPDQSAVQTAQALYKRHKKLKRTRAAVDPLLAAVQAEIDYLEQVDAALGELRQGGEDADRAARSVILSEIQDELTQAGYLPASDYRRESGKIDSAAAPRRYTSPSGFEVLVGRNNRQNDQLTFRTATDYDLWFHTQEIPGCHLLLRLPPGAAPDQADLEFAANLAACFSQAKLSEQVPVVYTQPKHVYKPKGAKLGMVIYKHETVIWGKPSQAAHSRPNEPQ